MIGMLRKRRVARFTAEAEAYVNWNYDAPQTHREPKAECEPRVRYSLRKPSSGSGVNPYGYQTPDQKLDEQPRYSLRDTYSSTQIDRMMRNHLHNGSMTDLAAKLDGAVDQTFVEKLMSFIANKGMKDSAVYKAAQIDRRLFSKIMSDSYYKPAKDTAIAISLALHLTLEQAKDLLSRAGYTFSHSDKRDVIIEYFFRNQIYNLTDINIVLENLTQKPIGR